MSSILAGFTARKAGAKQAAADKAVQEKGTLQALGTKIRATAVPALRRIAQRLSDAGHEAQVADYVDQYVQPQVALHFKPRDPNTGRVSPFPSMFTIVAQRDGTVKISEQVASSTSAGTESVYAAGLATPPGLDADALTDDRVERLAVAFVRATLERH